MAWSFALISGRLAEIYFNKTKKGIKFLGHCYVNKLEYETKREQRWIEMDTVKHRFVYRNKEYKGAFDNKIFKLGSDSR